MANASGNNQALQQRVSQPPAQQGGTFQDIVTKAISSQFKAIKSVVPQHVTPERLARVCLTTISRTPKLAECALETIVGAVMNCAVLGLEPNLLGEAYIIPFWNGKTKRMEAQFQVGYKGAIKLVRNSGEVATITAHEVCANDFCEIRYGTDEALIHRPPADWGERGEAVAYYATYKLKDGGYGFYVMTKSQVIEHMNKYSKSKDRNGKVVGPWADPEEFHEMAKKTCILKMTKYMSISIEKQEGPAIMEALERDGGVVTTKDNSFGEAFLDAEYVINPPVEPVETPAEPDESKPGEPVKGNLFDDKEAPNE